MKARMLDDKRRLVMPEECPPNSEVVVEQLNDHTWIVKLALPGEELKNVFFPAVNDLPEDPEWEKVETAFATAACRNLPEPRE